MFSIKHGSEIKPFETARFRLLDLRGHQPYGIVARMSEIEASSVDCPFCRIVAGSLPHHVIDEDDGWIAFLNITPAAPGHTLVVPKQHVAYL